MTNMLGVMFRKIKSNAIYRNTIIIVLINGLFLMIYKLINPNKEIERFYKETSPERYYLLQLATSILLVSFVFNARYLVSSFMKAGGNMLLPKLKNVKWR